MLHKAVQDFETMPIALVAPIHLCGDKVKALLPASHLKESNSTPLKFLVCGSRPAVDISLFFLHFPQPNASLTWYIMVIIPINKDAIFLVWHLFPLNQRK